MAQEIFKESEKVLVRNVLTHKWVEKVFIEGQYPCYTVADKFEGGEYCNISTWVFCKHFK